MTKLQKEITIALFESVLNETAEQGDTETVMRTFKKIINLRVEEKEKTVLPVQKPTVIFQQ